MNRDNFSSGFCKALDSHFKILKILWLIIPAQIILFSGIGILFVKFISKNKVFHGGNIVNGLTVAFAIISLILILAMKQIFANSIHTNLLEGIGSESDSAGTERAILKYAQAFKIKAIMGIALCESPTMFGFVLTVLSGNHIYILAFAAISFIGWKLFYFSPSTHQEFIEKACKEASDNQQ